MISPQPQAYEGKFWCEFSQGDARDNSFAMNHLQSFPFVAITKLTACRVRIKLALQKDTKQKLMERACHLSLRVNLVV